MKTKLFSAIIMVAVVLICLIALPTEASAETYGYYTYTVANGEATITDCDTSISGDVTIPAALGGYPVTGIGYGAFYWCTNLTSVTIGARVTSIGDSAFNECSKLTSIWVDANNSVYSSDSYGVLFNKNKTELILVPCGTKGVYTIPDSVTCIGDHAFWSCAGLTSVTLGNSVTSIGESAFQYCTGLTEIAIPDSVTSIGHDAFYGCSGLASVTLGNGVTSIAGFAFASCRSLTSISIPASVTSIGDSTFSGCNNLVAIWVDADNTVYSSDSDGVLFNKNKTELILVPIPMTGAYTIPDTVISIGNWAFSNCTGLTNITIPNSVTSIGEGAFSYCSGLTSISIPDGITRIESYAFQGCRSLPSVTIPDSVTSIGYQAFASCYGLTDVYISDPSAWCKISFGSSYANPMGYANNLHIVDAEGNEVQHVVLDDTVAAIPDYAFRGCTSLTSISIPNSVTSIGELAFDGCKDLTSITIPNSVTSIGSSAFRDCASLINIDIPNSVTYIGGSAFYGCSSLKYNVYDNAKYLGNAENPYFVLESVTAEDITQCKIAETAKLISPEAFYSCSGLTDITIPNSVTYIGAAAFDSCISLTNVIIPNSVTYIGEWAFGFCENLTSVTIGDGVIYIGEDAFAECGLRDIYISNPSAWCKIDDWNGCLKGSGELHILDAEGNDVHDVVLDDTVTMIPGFAFSRCTGLTSIVIPDSVTSIGFSAFKSCSNLTSVIYCGTPEQWSQIEIDSSNYSDNSYLLNATLNYHNWVGGTCTDSKTCTICGAKEEAAGHNVMDGICTICQRYGTCGDNLIWTLDDEGTLTISGTGAMTDYLRSPWRSLGAQIKRAVIEDGVTRIGTAAFHSLADLSSVTIPASVTSIGENVFYYCSALTDVYISDPSAWCKIAFANSFSNPMRYARSMHIVDAEGNEVQDVILNNTVMTIPEYAFKGCDSLRSIYISDSVTSIGKYAFGYCSSLEAVTIGQGVTTIEEGAFYWCESLDNIIIPDNVINIAEKTFESCHSLTTVAISNSVTSIEANTFNGCTALVSIRIPDRVTSIGLRAFERCIKLISITIPDGVTSIGGSAFDSCYDLTSVFIPGSVSSIGSFAFTCCTNLTSVTYCGTVEQWDGVSVDIGNDDLVNATWSYHNWTESSCTTPAVCTLCGEVGEKGEHNIVDGSCTLCQKYGTFDKKLTWELDEEGALTVSGTGAMRNYDFDVYSPWYDYRDQITSVVIENGVTRIGVNAFYGCSNLTGVIIPDSVTSIGDQAFYGCTSLAGIRIPESVNRICADAFRNCSALTSITIPGSVSVIDVGTFYGCTSLTEVVLSEGVTRIRGFAFYGCSSLTEIVIPEGVVSIDECAFYGCGNLSDITIPDSVTSIGNYAFEGCLALTNVTYCGTEEQWNEIKIDSDNDRLINVAREYHNYTNGECTICGDKVVYTITFKNWDGTILSAKTYHWGDAVTAPADPTRAADETCTYTFAGWDKEVVACAGDATYTATYTRTYKELPEDLFSYSISNGQVEITGYKGTGGAVTIPNTIESLPVTSIGASAFKNCTSLTSVTIGNGVTSIGNYAFSHCTGLTSVVIPDSVTSIGSSAFRGCSSLESMTIPFVGGSRKTASDTYQYPFGYIFGNWSYTGGVATKQYYYRYNTSSTTYDTYYIPSSLKSVTVTGGNILYGAFYNCDGLTSIVIPDSVTSIGDWAFYNCTSLTGITIPDSVTSIGDYAFYNCTGLTSIVIPDSVTSIGDWAFYGCYSLTSIVIPDSVTSIGGSAFYDCTGLTSVNISDIAAWCSVSFGGSHSNPLYYAKKLYLNGELVTNIVIPDGVTSIGSYAFDGCTGLTSVTIGSSVTSIGDYAFYNCTGLTSIVIPDSVTSIGSGAFFGCSSLESMTIPFVGGSRKTASDRDQYPFGYIFGTSSYTGGVATEQRYYGSSTSSTTYNTYYIPSSLKSVTVTGGNILYGAFYGCRSLTSITIPDSVTSIGDYAFYYCDGLTSITIPDSVTSIGDYAFFNCTGLTSVNISDIAAWCSVSFGESINNPLYYAKKLYLNGELVTNIVIPDGVTSIGSYAFAGYDGLTSIVIPDSVTSIGDCAFYKCTGLTSIVIPDSVTSIGDCAFYKCTGLTSVTIGNGVTSIGFEAFSYCTSLTSIVISDSVTSIGGSAFYDCTGLTSVNISDIAAWCSVSFGGSYSNPLYYAKKLYLNGELVTNIVIPDGVTSIGRYAFDGCTGLTSVTIGSGVTSIGDYAFRKCTGLTSVNISDIAAWCSVSFGGSTSNPLYYAQKLYLNGELVTSIVIPDSVTSIGSYAFYNCTGLTSIVIPDSVTSIGSGAFSGCSSLKSITIPFVGGSRKTASDTYQYPFGYIFGTSSYTGGVATKQYYYGSSASSKTYDTYYIPSSLKSVTVTGGNILYGAFYNCDGLISVTIPDSVTSIGNYAFYNCTGLTYITIPDSVTSIGYSAFDGCTGLTHVFYAGTESQRASISIGSYNTSLSNAFWHYEQVGGNYTEVSGCGWTGHYCDVCGKLGNVTTQGTAGHSFVNGKCTVCGVDECWAYSVTIDGVVITGYTGSDRVVTIPEVIDGLPVSAIGNSAFKNQTGITTIVIPNSVTSIGSYAFYGCSRLTGVTIPDSVTSIGSYAFYDCTKLTSVTIGNGVTSIGSYAFYNCDGLTSITIPDSVTSIGYEAFGRCDGLTSVTIGNGVTSIGSYAFYCSNLQDVYISDLSAWLRISFGGYYANPLYYAENLYLNGELVSNLIIPEGITSIGDYAFHGYDGLYSVTMPKGLTTIGEYAFSSCDNLKVILLPQGMDTIESYAFGNCYNLSKVYHKGTQDDWDWIIIEEGNDPLTSATLYNNFVGDSCEDGLFTVQFLDWNGDVLSSQTYCWGDAVTAPANPTRAADETYTYTFAGWDKTVVACAGDATYTATYTKQRKDGLRYTIQDGQVTITGCTGEGGDLIIPDTIEGLPVTSIGEYAFEYSNFTSITIPYGVTSIGSSAFSTSESLASVVIPDSVKYIDAAAFLLCDKLTAIRIPNGVTTIVNDTFIGCTSLTNVIIPNSVTSIGWDAFAGCSNLTSVTYCGTEDQWNKISIGAGNEYLVNATRYYSPANSNSVLRVYTMQYQIAPVEVKKAWQTALI